jgi:hypothetical protein
VVKVRSVTSRTDPIRCTRGSLSREQSCRALLNRLKRFRRIAARARYVKLGASFFAFVEVASMRISPRPNESTP